MAQRLVDQPAQRFSLVWPRTDPLLYDRRARNLLEAILGHGSKAAPMKDVGIAMPPTDRAALIRYLESL
ncbi:MAG: CxxC motif-containing protein (DUF1111 family) [Paracoccaceae bacterium]